MGARELIFFKFLTKFEGSHTWRVIWSL